MKFITKLILLYPERFLLPVAKCAARHVVKPAAIARLDAFAQSFLVVTVVAVTLAPAVQAPSL